MVIWRVCVAVVRCFSKALRNGHCRTAVAKNRVCLQQATRRKESIGRFNSPECLCLLHNMEAIRSKWQDVGDGKERE